MVGGIIHVYVEVAGDEEFMRCGCRSGEKRCEFIQKGRERFRECGGCVLGYFWLSRLKPKKPKNHKKPKN